MNPLVNGIYRKISENNYKLTNQRKRIIDIIIDNEENHLNCEEIYDEVRKVDDSIGLATIYRALKLFVKLNILTELNIGDGSIRYDLNSMNDDHNHHHLICNKCGRIIEVKDDSLESLEKEIERIYGFKVENHKCKFEGVCKDCLTDS